MAIGGIFTMLQTLVMRIPAVRRLLGLPVLYRFEAPSFLDSIRSWRSQYSGAVSKAKEDQEMARRQRNRF